jgi:hypothetical protein
MKCDELGKGTLNENFGNFQPLFSERRLERPHHPRVKILARSL